MSLALVDDDDRDPLRLIGQVLDEKYRVERLLGQGGMGVVYEAVHLKLSRRCALKFLRLVGRQRERTIVERFLREARIGAHLKIPGIVEVYDVEQRADGEMPYIVMEVLDGRSLGDRLRDQGPMEWREAFALASRAATPLIAAHGRGIIHRDLKPDNLFLCSTGELKVLDFGIARFAAERPLTLEGHLMGTPYYMSREQATAAHEVDARADVYSLGAVLYHAISGELVWKSPSYGELMRDLQNSLPVDIRHHVPLLPEPAAAVIRKAMSPDRDGRYATMRELQDALDLAIGAPRPARINRVSSPVATLLRRSSTMIGTVLLGPRRHPWRIAAVVAVAVVGLSLGGWLLLRTPRATVAVEPVDTGSSVIVHPAPVEAEEQPAHPTATKDRHGKHKHGTTTAEKATAEKPVEKTPTTATVEKPVEKPPEKREKPKEEGAPTESVGDPFKER